MSVTKEGLLDALCNELERILSGLKLINSVGEERNINVYPHNLPIREGDDETMNPEQPPEPYILVKLRGGECPGNGDALTVEAVLVICVYDENLNRQGYRDMLHIVNETVLRFGSFNFLNGKYEIIYPIEWAVQEDDTHPYYFGAVGINFEIPAIYNQTEEELC